MSILRNLRIWKIFRHPQSHSFQQNESDSRLESDQNAQNVLAKWWTTSILSRPIWETACWVFQTRCGCLRSRNVEGCRENASRVGSHIPHTSDFWWILPCPRCVGTCQSRETAWNSCPSVHPSFSPNWHLTTPAPKTCVLSGSKGCHLQSIGRNMYKRWAKMKI